MNESRGGAVDQSRDWYSYAVYAAGKGVVISGYGKCKNQRADIMDYWDYIPTLRFVTIRVKPL